MGTQLTIPFTVLPNGAVSAETDINIQIGQRVNALVSTEVGQRAMRATLGLPLSRLLFGISNQLVTAELRDQVTQQLNAYEPGINVLSVNPVLSQSKDGISEIQVDYQPILQGSTTQAASSTVVIEVGGTIQEVTINGNS